MQGNSRAAAFRKGGTARNLLARGIARGLHHGAWKFRHYECAWAMVQKELQSTVQTPPRVRPRLWRRGFISEAWVLYDLEHNDWRQYLSDYARFTKTRLINGRYAAILDNKLLFDRIVGGPGQVVPHLHGIVEKDRMLDLSSNAPVSPTAKRVIEELRRAGALVLKPLTGGGGRGIAILRYDGSVFTCNGVEIDEAELGHYVESRNDYMVCEFIAQHPMLARFYRETTNTLRLLTLQDDACDAFVASAVLRIGTARSKPTDNWSRGGLSASIDVETGRVGPAVSYPAGTDHLTWHTIHPDSGEALADMTIPHWQRIVADVLKIFRALPVLKYVGWDVVVTPDGFRIIEGNNYSDVNLLQVHGPLLTDKRTRDFYQRHGVL